jgi:hypothetical protein
MLLARRKWVWKGKGVVMKCIAETRNRYAGKYLQRPATKEVW